MTVKRKLKYLSNNNLLPEIAKSKDSYSSYLEPEHAIYDIIITPKEGETVEDALATVSIGQPILNHEGNPKLDRDKNPRFIKLGSIVRVHTYDHIPLDSERTVKPREKNKTHAKVSFLPFQHHMLTEDGWLLVGKSHWKGGLHNGHFSADHGRITNNLAMMLMKLVERYGSKGNWRNYSYNEEMQGLALVQLCQVALQFDESRTANAFAYYSTVVTNCFVRVLNEEKKNQALRDDLLIAAGQAPSSTRQAEHEMATMGLTEPKPLAKRRGRPPKALQKPPEAAVDLSAPRRGRPPKWLLERRSEALGQLK